MQREIKSRGKRVNNGEWVYGSLHNYSGHTWIIPQTANNISMTGYEYLGADPIKFFGTKTVDPKTVGQFTERKDKKGTEVYSGDVYDIGICTKVIRPDHFIEDTYELMKLIEDGATIEVIGNIHDNPELLKEA